MEKALGQVVHLALSDGPLGFPWSYDWPLGVRNCQQTQQGAVKIDSKQCSLGTVTVHNAGV